MGKFNYNRLWKERQEIQGQPSRVPEFECLGTVELAVARFLTNVVGLLPERFTVRHPGNFSGFPQSVTILRPYNFIFRARRSYIHMEEN